MGSTSSKLGGFLVDLLEGPLKRIIILRLLSVEILDRTAKNFLIQIFKITKKTAPTLDHQKPKEFILAANKKIFCKKLSHFSMLIYWKKSNGAQIHFHKKTLMLLSCFISHSLLCIFS
jgi:hypothetical protein